MKTLPRATPLCLAVLIVLFSGCTPTEPEENERFFYEASLDISDWSKFFAEEQIIDLQFPDTSDIPLSVYGLVLGKAGTLFIPDSRHYRIQMFDSSGAFLRSIGKEGTGPGEFSLLGGLQMDAQYNLYASDIEGGKITVFNAPDYQYTEQFTIPSSITKFLGDPEGNLIIYSPYNEKVVRRYDREENLLAEALQPKQEALRRFLARFQTGGLVSDETGAGLYAIFPEDFRIHHYKNDLTLVDVLRSETPSLWRPVSPRFPEELSPYKYNMPHQDWWDSFLHVARIFMPSDQVIAITLFESYNLNFEKGYVNLYSTDGGIIAEGLKIPHSGQILAMGNEAVYLATEAYLQEDGSVTPLKLRKYVFSGWTGPKLASSSQFP